MLKRGLAFALVLVMLLSVASAVEVPTGDGGTYQVSAWAQKDVAKALELGLLSGPKSGDYRQPIERGNFGMSAAKLVALAFDTDLDTYWNFVSLRDAMAGKTQTPIYTQLGILQGRGNGDLDQLGTITRQEAAVMLARAYRLYSGEIHDDAEPLTYADKGEIADWAMTDVQLMTHLGIMNGVGENQFAPKSSYSVEQCLVTLVRLYETTCKGKTPDQTNPFVMTEREQAMGKAWTAGLYYVTSAEQGGTLAVAHGGAFAGSMGPQRAYILVLDKDLKAKEYRNIIKYEHNTFFGQDENAMGDAGIQKLWVSEDGSKVYFQSTLENDVYPYNPDGTYGKLLFAKGVYTVTLDVATGKQTYTRADLT